MLEFTNNLDDRIITTSKLNNIIKDSIYLLKIIDVKTSFNKINDNSFNPDLKGLTNKATILIKVIAPVDKGYYLKIDEELTYNNPAPVNINFYEYLLTNNGSKNYNKYAYLKAKPKNRFDELLGLEFCITGTGVKSDDLNYNNLDSLILLNRDYRSYK